MSNCKYLLFPKRIGPYPGEREMPISLYKNNQEFFSIADEDKFMLQESIEKKIFIFKYNGNDALAVTFTAKNTGRYRLDLFHRETLDSAWQPTDCYTIIDFI